MTDPVTLAVVRGALELAADEMDLQLIRAAVSPIISETNDCAHGIFHPETGETIAQGRFGLPLFLANMQFTIQYLIGEADRQGGFRPGDIWILNDPYICGTHVQDVVLVAPHFVDGTLFALLASTGHWMDMGGSVPGGWVPTATEIHQEGILIPPVKIFENGHSNGPLISMIKQNVRLPDQVAGDLAAMMSVFAVGQRGIDALTRKYGAATIRGCVGEMIARSEKEMRSYTAEIPDGVYEMVDHFDNDGIVDEPIAIKLTLTVAESDLHFDFTGTSPAPRGPMNIAPCTVKSACFVALKHIFPDVWVNGGAFRPARFTIPSGSMLAAQYPTPVGGSLDVAQRIIDVVFGALAKAFPERAPAAPFGTACPVSISGINPQTNAYFVAVYPYPGGYGASARSDGLVNGTPPGSMAKFMSIEMSEHRYPLRFAHFRIREGSGGAGRHRGGCGTEFAIELQSPVLVSILGDRVDHPPFGVQGGQSASPNAIELVVGGDSLPLPMRSKIEAVAMDAGDLISVASPGGGGFGEPMQRELADIAADLDAEIIEPEVARAVHGVTVEKIGSVAGRPRYRVGLGAGRIRAAMATIPAVA